MEHPDYPELSSESRLDALNRRFSHLMRFLLRLPEAWEDEAQPAFKRHLQRIIHLALSLLLIGGILSALLVMAFAIKTDSSKLFFIGIGVIPGVYLLQFILGLFCSANLDLTFGAPIHLVSRLMPEVLTVYSILGLIGYLIFGVISITNGFAASLQLGLMATGTTLVALLLLFFHAWVAANSGALLGIRVADRESRQSPAEYLFSIVLFFGRFFLALVPYQFLGVMITIVACAVYAGVLLITGGALSMEMILFGALGIGMGLAQLLWVVLLPVLAHFAYLLIVSVADLGIAFFRIAKCSERIADLSEQAMEAATAEEVETGQQGPA